MLDCTLQRLFRIKHFLQAQSLGRSCRSQLRPVEPLENLSKALDRNAVQAQIDEAASHIAHHVVQEAVADDIHDQGVAPFVERNGIHGLHGIHGRRVLPFKGRKIVGAQEQCRPGPHGFPIKILADAEKYDLIVQDVVWVSPKLDVTDKIIKALSENK